ncbi:nitroreductase family protein [Oceanobacillus saliphilus]|uniref:nitroreductase family protein n=1 Tax=Oceanobacillus saliphilus TaxID=2925834 RepID=UPI00201DA7D1|nr:nitroreductase family protein [Oceanobacillus saliphilus]
MDILNTIKERRSTHSFKKQEVSNEILKEIFTYGSYAPSHYMTESWEIKLYQSKGKQAFIDTILSSYQRIGMINDDEEPKTLQMIKSMRQFLMAIPHHALIYFEKPEDPVRYEEEYASVAAFIQNSQLAAWEYGVGMLWTITPYMHDPLFMKDLGLDVNQIKIAAVLQIGYPEKVARNKGRTPIEEKLEVIKE